MNSTYLVYIDPTNPDESILDKAVQLLRHGKIIVYPTDTTYALGANALDISAVKQVFEIKKRTTDKPIHVVVSDIKMAAHFVILNQAAHQLAKNFLPGPLTLILPKKKNVPDLLVGGRNTLGIRIPNNKICLMLAQKFWIPFTATSANISGRDNLYTANEVYKQFSTNSIHIDLIIDQGALPHESPSTLVDLTRSPSEILREGSISKQQIIEALSTHIRM